MDTLGKNSMKKLVSRPLFLASEARAMGVHLSRLAYYVKIKLIERIARGVYRGVHSQVHVDAQWEELVFTTKSVHHSVVCLVSSLALFDLTDEIPREHWIAIPHATTAPKRKHARIIRMRDMNTGKSKFKLGKETIDIFNQERTIVDAFRYLSKEIAIKALKEALKSNRTNKLNIKKLQQYARQFRVNLDHYILALTTK